MSYQDFLKFQKEYDNNGINGVVKKIAPKPVPQEQIQTPTPQQQQQPPQEGGFLNSLKNLFSGENKTNTFQPKLLPPKPISQPTQFKDVFNKDSEFLPVRSQAEQNKLTDQYNQQQAKLLLLELLLVILLRSDFHNLIERKKTQNFMILLKN